MSHPAGLSQEQLATNAATYAHIERVRNLLNRVVTDLLARGEQHDQSKLGPPEVEAMAAQTAQLAGTTYGSQDYDAGKKTELMAKALKHHYAHNRHHPEHFKGGEAHGLDEMTLVDIIEMLCDWKASSERHVDGNLRHSIEKNADRFNISAQLRRIMENTVPLLEG